MPTLIVLLVSVLLTSAAFGYSERIEINKFNRIEVTGWAANVKVVANEEIKFARIRSTATAGTSIAAEFSAKLDQNKLIIDVPAGESPLAKSGQGVTEIFIESPSFPLEISVRSGVLNLKNWQKNVVASVIKGNILTTKHQGNQVIHIKRGNIVVTEAVGNLDLTNYDGITTVEKTTGELKLFQFSGEARLKELEGATKLKGYNAAVKIEQSKGRIDFDLFSGKLRTLSHEGAIYGSGKEAILNLGASIDPNIRVKSKSGKVVVSLPSGSGAYMNFGSERGDLVVPGHFAVDRLPNLKVARGRLKGTEGRGRVRVRTESAIAIFRVDR